jgi:hypothetical protein
MLEAAGLLAPGVRDGDLLIVAGIASQQPLEGGNRSRLPHPGSQT